MTATIIRHDLKPAGELQFAPGVEMIQEEATEIANDTAQGALIRSVDADRNVAWGTGMTDACDEGWATDPHIHADAAEVNAFLATELAEALAGNR